MPKALILYHTKTGHTKKMALAIAEGIQAEKVSVTVTEIAKANIDDLVESDAIVLGSPCYYGTMAAEVKAFLDASVKYHGKLTGKVGGAFACSGILGGGNETTVLSLVQALLIHGMTVPGCARISHYGPVAVADPDPRALEECVQYGRRIGELTSKLCS